jgi:hypothetical protein
MQTRLRRNSWLSLGVGTVLALAGIVAAGTADGDYRVEGECEPIAILLEFFDAVTLPALPMGWSSATWVTSNSRGPMPAADTCHLQNWIRRDI